MSGRPPQRLNYQQNIPFAQRVQPVKPPKKSLIIPNAFFIIGAALYTVSFAMELSLIKNEKELFFFNLEDKNKHYDKVKNSKIVQFVGIILIIIGVMISLYY